MKKHKLKIIYEDKYILVVDKKSGLLTIGTDKEREKTLFHEVYEYIKSKNKHNKIFIVHRLDKNTSGLVLFAKTQEIKNILQNNWDTYERKYYAIVEGKPEKNKALLKNKLSENKNYHVYVSNDGKLALTKYEVINTNNRYSLLDIEIKTGRKNQIRCQLDYINNPIVGDKKYRSKYNPINRLCLHAYSIKIKHPITKEEIIFKSNYPKEFNKIINCK